MLHFVLLGFSSRVIMVTMIGVPAILAALAFLGSVTADSATPSFNTSSSQKYIDNIELSLSALNDSEIPIWVDEWKPPKNFQKLFPFYMSGYDYDGSPVYVMEFGRWKVAEALRSYEDGPEKGFDLFIKYLDQTIYWIHRDGMANNSQGIVTITDYDGFAISNYASPLGLKAGLRQLATLDRLNKVLNYAFLINMNFAAESLLLLGRPFMGNILEKCEIFGTEKSKWLPHLARKIPTHQLPPWYGGPEDWQPVMTGLGPFITTYV